MIRTTRTRTFVLLVIMLATLLIGCIELDDNASTLYRSTPVVNPYEGELEQHDAAKAAPTVTSR